MLEGCWQINGVVLFGKTNPDLPGANQNVARTRCEKRLVSGVNLNGVILASLGVCFSISNRIWC